MFDLIFVGGGLSSSLAAFLMARKTAGVRVLVLDARAEDELIPQTWSFQTLPPHIDPSVLRSFSDPGTSWFADLISQSWSSYRVAFPRYQKTFETRYHSIRSEDFHERVQAVLGPRLRRNAKVETISTHSVCLRNGEVLSARLVIDSRGWSEQNEAIGFQKFLGLNVRVKHPHMLTSPLLMDAEVVQKDGFRFFYTLPWNDHDLLVEDTRYSESPLVDGEEYESEILGYIQKQGFEVEQILGRESGSLPLPAFDSNTVPQNSRSIGAAAGLFHPTTGYSFYEAVQTAELIAQAAEENFATIPERLSIHQKKRWEAQEFYRRLNNMLFHAAVPEERYRVLERFYEHDEDLITRFYAGRTHWNDKLRILSGRPPISVKKALFHFFTQSSPRGATC